MSGYEVVISDARLRHGAARPLEALVRDIGITGGVIAAISEHRLRGDTVIDAGGDLVTPSFVDAHLHLDKVHTWRRAPAARTAYAADGMGAAATAIELASEVKDHYDEAEIANRARDVLLDGLRHGVTHVRAFADTDTRAALHGVRPLLAVRDELRGLVDVEVVAFPQDGVIRDDGAADVVEEAVRLGADLVGGIPWIEDTDAEAHAHIATMVDIAVRHDRDVAMLTDDAGDPGLQTTAMLATTAIDRDWTGRVTACHARALATYPRPRLERLIRLARRAEMAFVTNPHTAPLALPVAVLLDAGIPVALGQDDIADAYYPFGTHDLLQVALLAAHVLDMTTPSAMERLLDMITLHPSRALRIDGHAVAVGTAADLVVLNGADAHEVLRRQGPPRHVLRAGHPVAATISTTQLTVPDPTVAAGHSSG